MNPIAAADLTKVGVGRLEAAPAASHQRADPTARGSGVVAAPTSAVAGPAAMASRDVAHRRAAAPDAASRPAAVRAKNAPPETTGNEDSGPSDGSSRGARVAMLALTYADLLVTGVRIRGGRIRLVAAAVRPSHKTPIASASPVAPAATG